MWATKLTPSADRFISGINFPVISFRVGTFAGLALLVSACGGGSNMPSVGTTDPGPASCPAGIGGMPSGCCDTTGAVLSPAPVSVAGCVNINPGGAPVGTTGTNGAGSAGGSVGDIGTAQGLVGGQVATGMAGQYSAATAGGQQPAAALANVVPNSPLAASNALNPTSGSASGGAGSGSGLGSGLDSNSIATAPDPSMSGSPGVSGATAADASPYGSGGGAPLGGILPNGARPSGFQFGNGFANGDGTGSASDIAFGTSSVDPMLGGDPEDYFTRIGIEDSLFKKVERRYRDTSMHWASAGAAPSRSMASVPNVVPGLAK